MVPHLVALVQPLGTLAFLVSVPHSWPVALAALLLVAGPIAIELFGRFRLQVPHQFPDESQFARLHYMIGALHFVNTALLVRAFTLPNPFSFDSVVALVLAATNAGWSVLVVAHELMHSRKPLARFLGRAMLSTVFYDHNYVEHIRGHHAFVGTPADPVTARYGETFESFWRRVWWLQFRSAWRRGAQWARRRKNSRKWTSNPVFWGVVAQFTFVILVGFGCGWSSLLAVLVQAIFAVRQVDCVNYFEHWGLARPEGVPIRQQDSWDVASWLSIFALPAPERHADHHVPPAERLDPRRADRCAVLPHGYFAMAFLVQILNRRARRLMSAELHRKGLGPFEHTLQVPVPATLGNGRYPVPTPSLVRQCRRSSGSETPFPAPPERIGHADL